MGKATNLAHLNFTEQDRVAEISKSVPQGGFHQFLPIITGLTHQLGQDCFPPYCFEFVIHQLPYYLTLYNLDMAITVAARSEA
jgi:hypothetical protein